MPQSEISLRDLAEYFESFLESQYFDWKVLAISDITFHEGMTIATITYQVGKPRKEPAVKTCRWSYRREDWDNRIIAYFHDQSKVKS